MFTTTLFIIEKKNGDSPKKYQAIGNWIHFGSHNVVFYEAPKNIFRMIGSLFWRLF